MKNPIAVLILPLTAGLIAAMMPGCSHRSAAHRPRQVHQDSAAFRPADTLEKSAKTELSILYSQAIADYIRTAQEDAGLRFDTLYFGKRRNGQEDDFPDIDLPPVIANTAVRLVAPEEGTRLQQSQSTSWYINLMGWPSESEASFLFVSFSDGFKHQFDCSIRYRKSDTAWVLNERPGIKRFALKGRAGKG